MTLIASAISSALLHDTRIPAFDSFKRYFGPPDGQSVETPAVPHAINAFGNPS